MRPYLEMLGGTGMKQVKNLAASVRERLMQQARSKGQDVNWLLTRYGLKRM